MSKKCLFLLDRDAIVYWTKQVEVWMSWRERSRTWWLRPALISRLFLHHFVVTSPTEFYCSSHDFDARRSLAFAVINYS